MAAVSQVSSALFAPRRGELWSVLLDSTMGSEIRKTRPCVVVSTDALANLPLRVIVPLTAWQTHHSRHLKVKIPRDALNRLDKDSAADPVQVRCVSLQRFRSRIGAIDRGQLAEIATALAFVVEVP